MTRSSSAAIAICALLAAWADPGATQDAPKRAAPVLPLDPGYVLVRSAGCASCHSPPDGPAFSGNNLGGGLAPNITPDPVSGIGAWSRDEVVGYLRTGHANGRGQAAGPMAWVVEGLQGASDDELGRIADWLHALPPARDPADRMAASARGGPLPAADDPRSLVRRVAAQGRNGAQLFSGACASCHGADGGGSADGSYPSLYHNTATGRRDTSNLVMVLLHGVNRDTGAGRAYMPAFGGRGGAEGALSNAELALLANYVLVRFGDPESATLAEGDFAARGSR